MVCLAWYVPGDAAGECSVTTEAAVPADTTSPETTTSSTVTTGAAVTTPDSPCGYIGDFIPPSFPPNEDVIGLLLANTYPFDAHYYQIRKYGDQPTLRVTLVADQQMIIDDAAGLLFFTDTSGLIFPFDGADGPCYAIY